MPWASLRTSTPRSARSSLTSGWPPAPKSNSVASSRSNRPIPISARLPTCSSKTASSPSTRPSASDQPARREAKLANPRLSPPRQDRQRRDGHGLQGPADFARSHRRHQSSAAEDAARIPEFVERFYKEGKAAAQLSHNNIVQAIDVGYDRGELALLRDGIHRGQNALRHHAAAAGRRGPDLQRGRSAGHHDPDGRRPGPRPSTAA